MMHCVYGGYSEHLLHKLIHSRPSLHFPNVHRTWWPQREAGNLGFERAARKTSPVRHSFCLYYEFFGNSLELSIILCHPYQGPRHFHDVVQLLPVAQRDLVAHPPAAEKLLPWPVHIIRLRNWSRSFCWGIGPFSHVRTSLSGSTGWKCGCCLSFLGTKPRAAETTQIERKTRKRAAIGTKCKDMKAGMFCSHVLKCVKCMWMYSLIPWSKQLLCIGVQPTKLY